MRYIKGGTTALLSRKFIYLYYTLYFIPLKAGPLPSLSRKFAGSVAVKQLSPQAIGQQASWLELTREIQLLGSCRHPNLLPLLGLLLDPVVTLHLYFIL